MYDSFEKLIIEKHVLNISIQKAFSLLFLLLTFSSVLILSPLSKAEGSHDFNGEIIGEEAQIYEAANFDAPLMDIAPLGQKYEMSTKLFNESFYRVRLPDGRIGYIVDSDIKPLFKVKKDLNKKSITSQSGQSGQPDQSLKRKRNIKNKNDKKVSDKQETKKKKPFQYARFVGFELSQIQFQEETMSDHRRDSLLFYGMKISGPDVVIAGDLQTDVNLLFHSGAPGYYQSQTKHGADGWIVMANFLFENYFPQGPNALFYLGFGPMLKYSKFELTLTDKSNGKNTDYSATDISLGAVFNAGVGLRLGKVALRVEGQYYWEKQMYPGIALSTQMEF